MSGRTARRARKEATYLLDMRNVFTVTLSDMMTAYGLDFGRCEKGKVKAVMRECCDQYGACHEELLRWAEQED